MKSSTFKPKGTRVTEKLSFVRRIWIAILTSVIHKGYNLVISSLGLAFHSVFLQQVLRIFATDFEAKKTGSAGLVSALTELKR